MSHPQSLDPPAVASRFGRVSDMLHRRRRVLLLFICLIAFTVRLGVTIAIRDNVPPDNLDMKSYYEYALRINEGGWWGEHVSYREPGYAFVLSAVTAITGRSPHAARFFNGVLDALTCVVVYLLARAVFGSVTVALLSAFWFAIYFHSIFFASMILRESLVTLLLASLLLALVHAGRSHRLRTTALAALAYIALVHTDARFLFHLPFIVLFIYLAAGGRAVGLRKGAVFVATFIVLMIPWQARNLYAYDQFVLINTRTLVLPVPWKTASEVKPFEDAMAPSAEAEREVRRLGPLRDVVYDFTEFYRAFRFRGEVRANSTAYEKPWSFGHNGASILMYGLLIPFFVYGFWVIIRKRMVEAYVFVLPVFAHTLLHIIKWGRPRYRVPVEPLLIIVAFFGASVLWQVWRERRARRVT